MRLVVDSCTTKGHKALNEDRVLVGDTILSGGSISAELSGRALFAIFDGVSTGGEGSLAAQIAAEVFSDSFRNNLDLPAKELVTLAAKGAQDGITMLKHEGRINSLSACTVTGFFIDENGNVIIFNAGDSRTYRMRNNILVQLTSDNTVVRQMERDGAPKELVAEAYATDAHTITRAIGMNSVVPHALDLYESFAVPGDVFFVCSDGVSDVLSDSKIEYLIGRLGQEHACEGIVAQALSSGSLDNVSAVLVRVFD